MGTEDKDRRLGDPSAWVAEHGDALFRYAYARLRDRGFAEDVVQETFLAAIRGRGQFAGRASERTWLTGILKHKIVDCLRRQIREAAVDNVDWNGDDLEALFDARGHWRSAAPRWADPDGALESREFWRTLQACLDALPGRLAQVFLLCELEELNGEAACKHLEVSATNLWVMLHRARMRLRQCLDINWFGRE